MKRFSVIMPVYLGGYDSYNESRGASDSIHKFVRAVNSFISQSFNDAELIIISDGCKDAEDVYQLNWKQRSSIRFKALDKQITFSGVVRQAGIEMAEGELTCYLDHDDMFGEKHLEIINENFDTSKYDWAYYDDYTAHNKEYTDLRTRDNIPTLGRIGTSSIVHKRSIGVQWGDGYGHDWVMIEKYLLPLPCKKIQTPQYYVLHIPGTEIDF